MQAWSLIIGIRGRRGADRPKTWTMLAVRALLHLALCLQPTCFMRGQEHVNDQLQGDIQAATTNMGVANPTPGETISTSAKQKRTRST